VKHHLREGLEGLGEMLRGSAKVRRAAGRVLDRVDRVVDRLTSDGAVRRVAGAALGGALEATGREIREAARGPAPQRVPRPGAAGKSLGIACSRHGNQPWSTWRHTLVCTAAGCGRVYQTCNPHGAHFAPAGCPCGAQLLPDTSRPDAPSTAQPFCSPCFDEVVAMGGRAVRANPDGQ
jgi:hypothetical protein